MFGISEQLSLSPCGVLRLGRAPPAARGAVRTVKMSVTAARLFLPQGLDPGLDVLHKYTK